MSPQSSLPPRVAQWLSAWSGSEPRSRAFVRAQDLLVLCVSFVFFLRYASPDMNSILGDNIAQVGYWRILFNPHLVGSLGSSSMKPGLILTLGPLNDLFIAVTGNTTPIRYVLSACSAATLVFIARVASELGGPLSACAALAYALFCIPFVGLAAVGSSVVFFLPLLCWGLWHYANRRILTGTILLGLASLVRLEAICVLGCLTACGLLRDRNLKHAALSAATLGVVVTLFVVVFYRVQGEPTRFNAGGTGLGYIFNDVGPTPQARFVGAMLRSVKAPASFAFKQCLGPSLGFCALVGFWSHPQHRSYLALFGIVPFLVTFATTGQGPIEFRYFQFVLPFLVAFGAGGIFALPELARRTLGDRSVVANAAVAAALLLGGALIAQFGPAPMFWGYVIAGVLVLAGASFAPDKSRLAAALVAVGVVISSVTSAGPEVPELARHLQSAPLTVAALDLLKLRPLPVGSRVLIDDDMIYGVIVRDPDYLGQVHAMQYLNVQSDIKRTDVLEHAEYIVLSKVSYGWDYLTYDPEGRGETDPLRHAVREAVSGRPSSAYGRSLRLMQTTDSLLILKLDS